MFRTILLFLSLTTLVNGLMDVSGCIASNITLTFTPNIDPNRKVSSYTWNKDIGPNVDPSFAKFEPSSEKPLETFMDDIKGRLFHYPDEPATVHITDLRESDAAKYTLVVRYEEFTGDSPEAVVKLNVKDVCFDEPKQVGKCAITTCFTGPGGELKTPMDKQTVNGYKLVKVCEDNDSGNYSCCNAAKKCQSLTMEVFRGTPPPMDQTGTVTTIGIVLGVLFALGVLAAAIGCYLKQKRQKQTEKETATQPTVEFGNHEEAEKEPLQDSV